MKEESLALFEKLKEKAAKAERIVFFGGAGVSTESGIPDFRSSSGLYRSEENGRRPEYLLSHTCLVSEPELFFDFYRKKMLYPAAKPNKAHFALARAEKAGKLTAVITQNIDGLHSEAGNEKVFELHGSVKRNYCSSCGKSFPADHIEKSEGVPLCPVCGGLIRPDVVLYEEPLDEELVDYAVEEIGRADLLIAGGTSLTVQPAASLVSCFSGETLALVNYSETPFDANFDLVLHESVGEILDLLF